MSISKTDRVKGGIVRLKFGVEAIPARRRENLRGVNVYEPLIEKLIEKTA